MGLFQTGRFTLHSGEESDFKIECDALTDDDWETIARQLYHLLPKWPGHVIGVPRGGLKLAEHLSQWIVPGSDLTVIADDVLTSGQSMEDTRAGITGTVIGVVAFARGQVSDWVIPLFTLTRTVATHEASLLATIQDGLAERDKLRTAVKSAISALEQAIDQHGA